MSTSKRSRAAHDLVRLDAGKKDRTAPAMPAPPEPAPLLHCLQVKIALREGDAPIWVDVANYPAEGGLDAFYDLIHRAPDDCFMTADAGGHVSFASIVAIRRPKGDGEEYPIKVEPTPPGEPRKRYRRLHVPVGLARQEIVEVANIPWTENGLALFALLIGKHRRTEFVTADYGYMPVRGVRLEDLRMPDEAPSPRHERLRPEDILRPEDLPE